MSQSYLFKESLFIELGAAAVFGFLKRLKMLQKFSVIIEFYMEVGR
jgi:hypothetical protein